MPPAKPAEPKIQPSAPISAPAEPPKLPDITDSPAYRAAFDNLTRLKLEELRLDRMYSDVQVRRSEALATKKQAVASILAGTPAGEVRRGLATIEADAEQVLADLKLTRRAIEQAEAEVRRLSYSEKAAVAAPFAPVYRAAVRASALAWLAYLKAMQPLDVMTEHLRNNELIGRGGCDNPLPSLKYGPVDRTDSPSARMIRELIDLGLIKPDEVPAGLAVAAPEPIFTPSAPVVAKPKPETSFKRAMRALGAAV